jgi:hypothetical protein
MLIFKRLNEKILKNNVYEREVMMAYHVDLESFMNVIWKKGIERIEINFCIVVLF